MTQEKAKKRGRPSQLLQMAELHAFVEFLLEKRDRSELQNQVITALQTEDFNFDMLSEAQQILVKEALKPYREHLKLKLLFEELNNLPLKTEYEQKFLDLYELFQKNALDQMELNILKTLATRYLNFKAQKLEYSDLELYLSQIQKKDAGKKRKAENQRKFEVGGGVLGIYKVNNDESLDPEKLLRRIRTDRRFSGKFRQSKLYTNVWALDLTLTEKHELVFEVLHQLTAYSFKGQTLTLLDLAIIDAQKKIKSRSEKE